MADEFIDILNEEGEPTGEILLKSKAHANGLWHASAQVWIITPDRKVLLQQRAANKDSYPNLWDISVAGHLSAGDTPLIAALREIEEEIGLQLNKEDLQYLKTIKRQKVPKDGFFDNEFNHLFLVKNPIEIGRLKLQESEVAAVKLMDIKFFEKSLTENQAEFVPHGEEYYRFILTQMKQQF